MECRKRTFAGKAATLGGAVIDPAGLPVAAAEVRLDGAAVATAVVPSFRSGGGRLETRGARAPPPDFA
ncbi:hypothetical protein [Shinella sp. BYT-45]|uniref:hypothetical protein n=1 Tax=Shinella sp. BYT-45 TaxID=3377377 RepID=UPI0039808533